MGELNYEKVLVGAVSLNPGSIPEVAQIVEPPMLAQPWRDLYAKLLACHEATGTVDLPMLALSRDELVNVTDAMDAAYTPSLAATYARAIRARWKRYKVARAAEKVLAECKAGNDPDDAVAAVFAASAGYSDEPTPGKIVDGVRAKRERVKTARTGGRQTTGIATGFPTLDKITDGIGSGHLWVAGGYTSAGKSFLALNVALAAIADGHGVSFVTLEMSPVEIAARASAIRSGIPSEWHALTPQQEAARAEADEWVAAANLRITSAPTLSALTFEIRRAERDGKSLVVVDYLQLVKTADRDSTYDSMRKVAQELQAKLRGSSVSVFALSQVSNDGVKNPGETIDFKGAGDIAASCDVALTLRSAHTHEERAERSQANEPLMVKMDVRKNRHGRVGTVPISLEAWTGRMAEVQKTSPDAVFFTR